MQDLKKITEKSFIAGYNDKSKPEDLRTVESNTLTVYMADIKNAFIEQNMIIERNGYSMIGNAPVSKAVLGQAAHEPSGGSKYILRARNNAGDTNSVIEGWSGTGNFAALTSGSSQTADLKHEFVTASGSTYIFNGTDAVGKTTNATSMSTVAGIPRGKGGRWWHNFLFVYGVSGNTSRLYFSDVNTPETFDAVNGYIDINPDDNEAITTLGVLKDNLVIFKETKIFLLTGFGTADFTMDNLLDFGSGIGTIAPRSVVETGNDIYFITFFGKTPHIKSIKRTITDALVDGGVISDAITGTMNRIQTAQIANTSGAFDGRRVWFAICTTGTTNNEVVVYDTLTGGWTRMTGINANIIHTSTISGARAIYFGSATANGKSYVLDTSTNDDGEAIDFVVDTPAYMPSPGYKAKYKYMYLTADTDSDVDLNIDYSKDGFTFNDLKTLSLTGKGAAFGTAIFGTSKFGATTVVKERINNAGGTAYFMQYRFANNTLDDHVTLREWEIFYRLRALRDT